VPHEWRQSQADGKLDSEKGDEEEKATQKGVKERSDDRGLDGPQILTHGLPEPPIDSLAFLWAACTAASVVHPWARK